MSKYVEEFVLVPEERQLIRKALVHMAFPTYEGYQVTKIDAERLERLEHQFADAAEISLKGVGLSWKPLIGNSRNPGDETIDRDQLLWTLELIMVAALSNSKLSSNSTWRGVIAAAHACVHFAGLNCAESNCAGATNSDFVWFVDC